MQIPSHMIRIIKESLELNRSIITDCLEELISSQTDPEQTKKYQTDLEQIKQVLDIL
jgi:hypothetical protein